MSSKTKEQTNASNGSGARAQATHISQLLQDAPQTYELYLKTAYGYQYPMIVVGILTRNEWDEIGAFVKDPAPPKQQNGLPNYNDMQYQKELRHAADMRSAYRCVVALERGGMQFAGSAIEDKAKEFLELPYDIVEGINSSLGQNIGVMNQQLRNMVDSFREGRNGASAADTENL